MIMYALVDTKLDPIPGTILCSTHFIAEHTKPVAEAAEGYLGWRPIKGDFKCIICGQGADSSDAPKTIKTLGTAGEYRVSLGGLVHADSPQKAATEALRSMLAGQTVTVEVTDSRGFVTTIDLPIPS